MPLSERASERGVSAIFRRAEWAYFSLAFRGREATFVRCRRAAA